MTSAELQVILQREGFRSDVYSVDGTTPSYEGLMLERTVEGWEVTHFERGMKRLLGFFQKEEDACQKMYELLSEYFR